jgi:hypothetical protein
MLQEHLCYSLHPIHHLVLQRRKCSTNRVVNLDYSLNILDYKQDLDSLKKDRVSHYHHDAYGKQLLDLEFLLTLN